MKTMPVGTPPHPDTGSVGLLLPEAVNSQELVSSHECSQHLVSAQETFVESNGRSSLLPKSHFLVSAAYENTLVGTSNS